MLKPIIIKEATDHSGIGDYWVELWQGDQHIKLYMGFAEQSDGRATHKWEILKEHIDRIYDYRRGLLDKQLYANLREE